MIENQEAVEDFLEHVGVKGMKWGVRRERRNQARFRAGQKGGPKVSKVRALGSVNLYDIARGRGITGGAQRKALRVQGQLDRFDAGQATTMDVIKRYGSTRVSDLVPVREKNVGKRTTVSADKVVVAAAVGLFVANQALSVYGRRKMSQL